jgi:NAD-dependent dihydropyrimidine dehydrogenase PreA subunit
LKVFDRQPLNIDKVHIPQGQVYLIPDRCKGCELCIHFCPQEVLETSGEMNAKGYHYPTIVPGKENACIHCEFCALICSEFAIFTLATDGGGDAG